MGEGFQMMEAPFVDCYHVSADSGANRPVFDTDGDGFEEIRTYDVMLYHVGVLDNYGGSNNIQNFCLLNQIKNLPPEMRPALKPSVLHLFGDLQVHELEPDDRGLRPSRYLDRRSPTLVLGPVLRRYFHVGVLKPLGLFPIAGADGDSTEYVFFSGRYLPFFWSLEGKKGGLYEEATPVFEYDEPWPRGKETIGPDSRSLTDLTTATMAEIDVRYDVFKGGSGRRRFGQAMTCIFTHTFNWVYDRVVANSRAIEHASLLPDTVPSLTTATDVAGTTAEEFFYGYGGLADRAFCFNAANLSLRQFRARSNAYESALDIFPRGLFNGSLASLRLFDDSLTAEALVDPTRGPGEALDLRLKAVCVFADEGDFKQLFFNDLGGGGWTPQMVRGPLISYVQGELDLTRIGALGEGTPLFFVEGGMIIADGDITVGELQRHPAIGSTGRSEALVLVSINGSIIVDTSRPVDACLVALSPLGTVKRHGDFIHIRGSVAVDTLDVDPMSAGSLFAGQPWLVTETAIDQPTGRKGLSSYRRSTIEYDPALEPTELENYQCHYRVALSETASFFKVSER